VLFNTNGTLLNERRGRDLIDSGLDELRVSLDAAESQAFKVVRGKDAFDRIVANVRNFRALQRAVGAETPRVSLWLTGLKETIAQLPAFVDLAHSIDVSDVHLQRLVYFPDGQGLASAQQALFERLEAREEALIRQAAARCRTSRSLRCFGCNRARDQPQARPWRAAMVAVRAAVDAHVLHRTRQGLAVLHRPVLDVRLRRLHAR